MARRFIKRVVSAPAQRVNTVLSNSFQSFVKTESSSGIVLLVIAVLALVWANSPWAESYFHLWHTEFVIGYGDFHLEKHISHWINDGLMAIFFLLVGLEIKREILDGELSSLKKSMLPVATAVGGMLVPALIYFILNTSGEGAKGWAIPMATDIAFALGILTLAGSRVPVALKVVLTALAIVDDLGAVLVIAIFYTSELHLDYLGYAGITLGVLVLLNLAGVRSTVLYLLPGIVLWYFVLKSGVHATIGGVLLAFTIPANTLVNPARFIERARNQIDQFKDACEIENDPSLRRNSMSHALEELEESTEKVQSPLVKMEHGLTNWVAFGIMPVFALANAGVSLGGDASAHLFDPITLGVVLGLFLGKQLGIVAFAWVFIKLKLAEMPKGVTWQMLYGLACLGGIGFTMSLFVADLSFGGTRLLDYAKIGILLATAISAIVGVIILRRALKKLPPATPASS